MHSLEYSRRLVARISSMRNPLDLLDKQSYWDPGFLALYLDELDEMLFQDPVAALSWAEVAIPLSLLQVEPDSETARANKVRAYSVIGTALRRNHRLEEARNCYEVAARLHRSLGTSSLVWGDLLLRLAALRIDFHDHRRAQAELEEATRIFEGVGSPKLGEVLVLRGFSFAKTDRYKLAIDSFGRALVTVKPSATSPAAQRIHHSAVHNLAFVVAQRGWKQGDLQLALRLTREARRFLRDTRPSISRYSLIWLEGVIRAQQSYHPLARNLFLRARKGFIRLELPYEVALVSLDLGELYLFLQEWPRLKRLAGDTFIIFRSLGAHEEGLAALQLWKSATESETLTRVILEEVRGSVTPHLNGQC